jgi:UDP-4-amino-4,6-dideoxy-N-acetyl-beta-L-altrosamine transaminase
MKTKTKRAPKMIPYSRQTLEASDVAAVVKTLKSDWLTQGPKVAEFEKKLAETCGARFAVAVSSGTAALHLACLALGVQSGDEVITTPNTFAASANCVVYCGGKPVFADIDPHTFNLSPQAFEETISPKTKGVIPVHFAGLPCEMKKIHETAKKRGLFVLEDGSHALGARYWSEGRWVQVGSCAHADACVFSFHPVKGITTGEGGAITTNNAALYERLVLLRTHGITKSPAQFHHRELAFWGDGLVSGWYYEMQELGFNYRIPDVLCALGLNQLKRLGKFIRARRAIAAYYDKTLAGERALELPKEPKGYESAYHLYVIRLRLERLTAGRAQIFDALRHEGLGVQVHYIPVHYQPYYRHRGYKPGLCPNAEAYYERVISIPVFPGLTPALRKQVVARLCRVLRRYEA